ncbi:hypothetical protein KP509_25G052200 [Ceratopteris richardii]|uniref:Bax inhibitor 1 n=1 Tax=Ceratopteris richardii TaxID=49495 RepID=A0A8T2RS83_CERRI|nr:hypothetical protein KP509_25G052200 [Ceratopteris richardii]
MDFVYGAFPRSSSSKNSNRLSIAVQQHLVKVYETLCAALVVASVGVYLHLLWSFGGILTSLGTLGLSLWLLKAPSTPSEEGKRLKLLLSAAFLHGASVGPLIELVLQIDSGILVTAFVGAALIFGCFSGAAILARNREFLYLGGVLSSALSLLFWLRASSYLFGSSSAYFFVELYGGMFLFMGYVLYDTQLIIAKADLGDLDHVKHALDLFVDLMGLFVRLLAILAKNSTEKSERERKQRKR